MNEVHYNSTTKMLGGFPQIKKLGAVSPNGESPPFVWNNRLMRFELDDATNGVDAAYKTSAVSRDRETGKIIFKVYMRCFMRKEIDINTWERKEHFEFYSNIATPHYCVAFNIDITNLLAFTRKHKISFYYSLIYLCTQSINEIDEFLLETEDNKVYKIDRRVPCFTDLKKGATSFHMVSLPCDGDLIEFATNARKESENNPLSVYSLGGLRESQIVFSCIPWADITMCTNERDYTDPKLKDDTAPILVWGKYTEQNGKYMINMTLDVNHRFIDGYFVGQFVQKLEEKIAELK